MGDSRFRELSFAFVTGFLKTQRMACIARFVGRSVPCSSLLYVCLASSYPLFLINQISFLDETSAALSVIAVYFSLAVSSSVLPACRL